jgi:hypothetical protein
MRTYGCDAVSAERTRAMVSGQLAAWAGAPFKLALITSKAGSLPAIAVFLALTMKKQKINAPRMPIAGVPQVEVDNNIALVEAAFGASWLQQKHGYHKLQRLWQRRDALATIELSALGDSIAVLKVDTPEWVEEKITCVKSNSANSHGHLFEVVGGAMIRRVNDTYRPTAGNTPGIDGMLTSVDGFAIRLSLKHHFMSAHEASFRSECQTTRGVILNALKANVLAHQVLIDFRAPLLPNEWHRLRDAAANIRDIPEDGLRCVAVPDKAFMVYSRMRPETEKTFAHEYKSDTFLAICPYHVNEQKGFCDKIYGAIANLRKHARVGDRQLNAIFMRVHQTATINDLANYASETLADQNIVDAIFLFQWSVTRRGEATVIAGCVRPVESPRWAAAGQTLKICSVYGLPSQEPSYVELRYERDAPPLRVSDSYVFQAGDHYYNSKAIGDAVSGQARSPADGIHQHVVMDVAGGRILISGKYAREEELVIL